MNRTKATATQNSASNNMLVVPTRWCPAGAPRSSALGSTGQVWSRSPALSAACATLFHAAYGQGWPRPGCRPGQALDDGRSGLAGDAADVAHGLRRAGAQRRLGGGDAGRSARPRGPCDLVFGFLRSGQCGSRVAIVLGLGLRVGSGISRRPLRRHPPRPSGAGPRPGRSTGARRGRAGCAWMRGSAILSIR